MAPHGQESNRTLWVGNIECWMDEAYISQTFAVAGPVSNVKVVRDPARGTGFGFVQFADHEHPKKLLDRLDGQPLTAVDGSRFRLNWALYGIGETRPSCEAADISLYIGNLDLGVGDTQLLKFFSSRFPSVVTAKVIADSATGISKGFGFVRFRDTAEGEAALAQLQGAQLGAKPLKLRRAMKQGRQGPSAPHGAGFHFAGDCGGAGVGSLGVPPPPPAVRPVGHPILVPGTYGTLSEADLAAQFGVFGTVFSVQAAEDGSCTAVEFRERGSAEAAAQYLQETLGIGAYVLEAEEHDQSAALAQLPRSPAITNMTMHQASSQLQAHLQAQLDALPKPSQQHFWALLQDPRFAPALERALAGRGGAAGADADLAALPWLLEDRPALFAAALRVAAMNADFLPKLGAARSCHRGLVLLPAAGRLLT